MAKIRLQINSTAVFGVYGRVDISFNGIRVANDVELSASTSTLTYDVTSISTDAENTIKIDLLNDQAYDSNNDNDFNDAGDETLRVTISSAEYSLDGSTFTAIIPQVQSTFTVPSGANSGMVVELKPAISEFIVWGNAYLIKFTTNGGLVDNKTDNKQPKNPIATVVDGIKIAYIDGNTYDFDGNII